MNEIATQYINYVWLCTEIAKATSQLVTRSSRHTVNSSQVNSSQACFFTESTRHTVISSHSHLVTSPHGTKLWVGTHNSLGMQILRVTTKVQSLSAQSLRGAGGKCFFDPSSLKILSSNFRNFFIFCSERYGQRMEKNIGKSLVAFSRKFHLKIAIFQILPILWLGDF